MLISSYTYFPIIFILGLFTGFLLRPILAKVIFQLFSKLSIVKYYWKFIMIFTIIYLFSYGFVFFSVNDDDVAFFISVVNDFGTLIFAIFVGYFAFLQVEENRLEKLREDAYYYVRNQHYTRARKLYEKVFAINRKDYLAISNLLEVYLLLGDCESFDQKISYLNDAIEEGHERIVFYYLNVARYLLIEDLGNVKVKIAETIEFLKDNPDDHVKFSWEFDDIRDSKLYKDLTDQTKTLFDNFIKYLRKSLSKEDMTKFAEGDYLLSQRVIPTPSAS